MVPALAAPLRFHGLVFGRGAAAADAPHLDLRLDDAPERPHGVRDAQRVEFGALEIPCQAAADADVVMVVRQVRVEADALPPRPERGDEAQVVEHPERAVDRVDRQRRHPLADRAEHGLGVGVLQARGDLPEDFEALVRELDARGPDGRLEAVEPPVNGESIDRVQVLFLLKNDWRIEM